MDHRLNALLDQGVHHSAETVLPLEDADRLQGRPVEVHEHLGTRPVDCHDPGRSCAEFGGTGGAIRE